MKSQVLHLWVYFIFDVVSSLQGDKGRAGGTKGDQGGPRGTKGDQRGPRGEDSEDGIEKPKEGRLDGTKHFFNKTIEAKRGRENKQEQGKEEQEAYT